MNEFTPAQTKVIETWTEKRDTLLREIGVAETTLSDVRKATTEEGLNLEALHKSIAEAKGRLAELDALEDRKRNSVAIDVAELEARKSRLEGECLAKESAVIAATQEESRVIASINILCEAHDKMADQAKIVNQVVGQIIETSQAHMSEVSHMMIDIKAIASEVIEKGNENVTQTNIVLEKLPKYIFELQRPIPVRRTYAVPRGTVIEPDKQI